MKREKAYHAPSGNSGKSKKLFQVNSKKTNPHVKDITPRQRMAIRDLTDRLLKRHNSPDLNNCNTQSFFYNFSNPVFSRGYLRKFEIRLDRYFAMPLKDILFQESEIEDILNAGYSQLRKMGFEEISINQSIPYCFYTTPVGYSWLLSHIAIHPESVSKLFEFPAHSAPVIYLQLDQPDVHLLSALAPKWGKNYITYRISEPITPLQHSAVITLFSLWYEQAYDRLSAKIKEHKKFKRQIELLPAKT
ncbi:MAG: hypothetical protein Q8N99_07265 [Nanoarchaeota archaeon]|nr:hypothetical protein [Nanoarchaeota archaeon]